VNKKMFIGTIKCKCGQLFSFESASNNIECIQCHKGYDITNYPVKEEEEEIEEATIIE